MNILMVDDDKDCRQSVAEFLGELGHNVVQSANGKQALEEFLRQEFHMVISDLRMPEMSGLDLLQAIRNLPGGTDADIVVCTGYGDMDSSIKALRAGAYDYIQKPINIDEMVSVVERSAEHQALLRDNRRLTVQFKEAVTEATAEVKNELILLKKTLEQIRGIDCFEVHSKVMQEIVRKADLLHKDPGIPVLIEGETGTGKELVARYIHYGKENTGAPFVDLNCAAITPSIFESELFGYEAGAFTGGSAKGQKGKMDMAQGGTLFLDEITEIPIELQAKLLRVIQEKEFYRVGGLKKIKSDVRFICATNQDIEQSVARREFRQDLYYRLNVVRIHIPPLRERQADIIPLAKRFITHLARKKNKHFQGISNEAAEILLAHSWPGNVRELRNLMEWVVLMWDDDEVKPLHLGMLNETNNQVRTHSKSHSQEYVIDCHNFVLPRDGLPLEEYTNRLITEALKMHRGNKTETAKYLGISRRSLYSRIDKT